MEKSRNKLKATYTEDDHDHSWAPLVAQVEGKNVPTSVYVCLKCGIFKVGEHTIKISRFRLDMGNLPIKNASEVHGTVYYS